MNIINIKKSSAAFFLLDKNNEVPILWQNITSCILFGYCYIYLVFFKCQLSNMLMILLYINQIGVTLHYFPPPTKAWLMNINDQSFVYINSRTGSSWTPTSQIRWVL